MQLPPCSRQKLIAALIEKAAVNRRQIEMNEHTKIGVVDNVFFYLPLYNALYSIW
jgi:hypothetical protein